MITLLKSADEEDWENFISKNSESRFYHGLSFRKFLEKTYPNCKGIYFLKKNGGKIKAAFPLFLLDNKILGKKIISLPFLDNGGFLGEYNVLEVKNLLEILNKRFSKTPVELRLNKYFKSYKLDEEKFLGAGFSKDTSRSQMITSLENESVMWKKFHKHTRNDIRKAEKSDLQLRIIKDSLELKAFYRLYFQNMKKFGTPQHSYEFFHNLLNMLGNNFYGLNCYKKNTLIGSIILLFNKNFGYVAFNVSNPEFRKFRPNDLLYWESIKYLRNRKVKSLDLGQVEMTKEHSRARNLYKFKKKWLAKDYERAYFYFPRENSNLDRKDTLKKFRTLWSFFPKSILRFLGPKISSELGN